MRFVGIDPATNTGFVALDENGDPLVEVAFRGKGIKVAGGISPVQRVSLQNQLYSLLRPGDIILKEGIANGNMMLITTSKIHGGLEDMITRKELRYDEVAPLSVKKFVDVNILNIDKGLKGIEKEKAKKAEMAAAALKHFGYENPSHDIVDAFIIAKICEAVYRVRKKQKTLDDYPLEYQREVIWSIVDPAGYEVYKESKKKKPKTNKRLGKPAAADSHTHLKEQQFLF